MIVRNMSDLDVRSPWANKPEARQVWVMTIPRVTVPHLLPSSCLEAVSVIIAKHGETGLPRAAGP